MLVAQREGLCATKVEVFGVVVHNLRLWRTSGLCACPRDAVKRHKPLPCRAAAWITGMHASTGAGAHKARHKQLAAPEILYICREALSLPRHLTKAVDRSLTWPSWVTCAAMAGPHIAAHCRGLQGCCMYTPRFSHLLSAVGHRDGPALLDAVEEPFLHRVVVQGTCAHRSGWTAPQGIAVM